MLSSVISYPFLLPPKSLRLSQYFWQVYANAPTLTCREGIVSSSNQSRKDLHKRLQQPSWFCWRMHNYNLAHQKTVFWPRTGGVVSLPSQWTTRLIRADGPLVWGNKHEWVTWLNVLVTSGSYWLSCGLGPGRVARLAVHWIEALHLLALPMWKRSHWSSRITTLFVFVCQILHDLHPRKITPYGLRIQVIWHYPKSVFRMGRGFGFKLPNE